MKARGRPWPRRVAPVVVAAWLGPRTAAGAARDGFGAGTEHASPAPRVELTGCPSSWNRDLRRSIDVEIGVLDGEANAGTTSGAPPDGARRSTLSVRCGPEDVVVEARGAAPDERLERKLSRDDLPAETAPRVVALAAVELLAALDPALRRRPAAKGAQPPTRTATPAPPSADQRADDRRFSVVASGVYRAFEAPAGIHAWGGALDGRRASIGGAWSVAAGIEVAGSGDRPSSLGSTSALLASVRASTGVRVSLARGALGLSLDVGARAGGARLVGRSAGDPNVQGSTVVRPWGGPLVAMTGQLAVSWLCLQLGAEGGWAAVSAAGFVNEERVLAASGPWVALSLGAGFRTR